MAIHYVLRDNPNTPDPNDRSAQVIPTGSADENDLFDRMEQGGSTLRRTDMVAFMELLAVTMGAMLKDGMRVNTRVGSFFTSIEGVFTSAEDVFEPPRHTLNVSIAQGPRLKQIIRTEAVTQKDVAALPEPVLVQFKNVADGSLNSVAKTGGVGEIKGDDLKFNPAAADEGIFFVPATGSAVKVSSILNNFPKTLSFQIPTLTAQTYNLEVRRRFTTTGALRTGTLPVQVTGVP